MIRITTNSKTRKNIASVCQSAKGLKRGLRLGLYEIGRENVKHTRKLILDKNKTGRIYNIKGRRHQSSAPGEAPANFTGTLQKKVSYSVRDSSEVEFGDKAFYGLFLELGTKNKDGSIRMDPREHLAKTVEAKKKDNQISLLTNVDRELKHRADR